MDRVSIMVGSAAMRVGVIGSVVLLAGCSGLNGGGSVSAEFFVEDCPPGTDKQIEDYGYDAAWLATERYSGVVIVQVQEYRVRIEETDSVAVRIGMDDLIESGDLVVDEERERVLLADPAGLTLPLAFGEGRANATLSLFQTCANFPTLHATSGTLRITDFDLALDAEDTGSDEHIAGSLTATIARSDDLMVPAGTMVSDFDFEPPSRPTISFK
ncbi:MAG: hypothetical protein RMA76_08825 [Deltaproteobacteria bacterium]|jgi:hypothetical protein